VRTDPRPPNFAERQLDFEKAVLSDPVAIDRIDPALGTTISLSASTEIKCRTICDFVRTISSSFKIHNLSACSV
jgi:hypothetical protein